MAVHKRAFMLLVIVLGSWIPVACGSNIVETTQRAYGELEALDPSGMTVRYWYPFVGSHATLLEDMIADFNAQNPWKITVKGAYKGSYEDIQEMVKAGLASDLLPDLSVAYRHQTASYANLGALVDLTSYIESEKWGLAPDTQEDFYPGALALQLPHFEGQRFEWPTYRSLEVLYYNKDWLNRLGYSHPPQTWTEFRHIACQAAMSSNQGNYGYEFSLDPLTFMDILLNHGGQFMNDEADTFTFGDDTGLETLQFLRALIQQECASVETRPNGDLDDFGAGQVLFTISSSLGLPFYRSAVANNAGFEWDIAPVPHQDDAPTIVVYGATVSIFRSWPEKQLATWLFLKWLTEPEQQARWAAGTGYLPVRRSAAHEMREFLNQDPQYQKVLSFLENNWAVEPGVASFGECRAEIAHMLESTLLQGNEPLNTWLFETQQTCNQMLTDTAPR